jgi:hypothetical protein
MKLFIAERPNVHNAINQALPNVEAEGITNVHLFYKFVYDGYTFPSQPRYQVQQEYSYSYQMRHYSGGSLQNGTPFNFKEATFNDFLPYSEICLFIECDHSGVRCSDLILDLFLGDMKSKYPVTFALIETQNPEHIAQVFKNRMDYFQLPVTAIAKKQHNTIDKYRKKYQVKDYIDFNFNGLIKQFFPTGKLLMTRNKIITLLLLENAGFTEGQGANETIGREMSRNKIGSPASISPILSTLIDAKFITPEVLRLTKKGKSFLNSLPANIRNFDSLMHFQTIENNKECSHEQTLEAIEAYLIKLFEPCLNKD